MIIEKALQSYIQANRTVRCTTKRHTHISLFLYVTQLRYT